MDCLHKYEVLLHKKTYQSVVEYLKGINARECKPGLLLDEALKSRTLSGLDAPEFLELLVNTKYPQIFAESAVSGDGSDWNRTELEILGDVSIAVQTDVYDDGKHFAPIVHERPFRGTLLYVAGALLNNGKGCEPVDLMQVTAEGRLDAKKYSALYERRLLPAFLYAQQQVSKKGKKAFITIPGLGCGCFAGQFRGQLGDLLKRSLMETLSGNVDLLKDIAAVYFDPYDECSIERVQIGHLSFLVNPLAHGSRGKPQLCRPHQYEEVAGEFTNCELFSVVAWDHVSWPGNDFYIGSRATDDGVKAAATSSMAAMTGVEGVYNPLTFMYEPPQEYRTWGEVVSQNGLRIKVRDNLIVYG